MELSATKDDDAKKHSQDNKNGEKLNPKIQKQSELLLAVSSFLGGLTFAAMIFVMQSQESFVYQNISFYPEILITSLAGISFVFILSSLALLDPATGHAYSLVRKGYDLAITMTMIGWISILILIPFILLPFTLYGAILLGILEIGLTGKLISYYIQKNIQKNK